MKKVRFGEWISEGFQLLKAEWQSWVLISLIYFIPVGIIYGISQAVSFQFNQQMNVNARSLEDFIQIISQSLAQSIILSLITAFAMNFVQAFLLGGMYKAAFKQIRGESIGVGDLFSGTDLFVKILVASVLLTIIQFVTVLMCYIPMLVAQGLLFFTIPLIVRQNLEPVDALKTSYQATKQDWLMFILYAFVVNVLAFIGVIGCLIGILFTFPLLVILTAVAFRDCFEAETKISRAEALSTKFCHACGQPLDVKANFCGKCGASQV